MAHIKFWFHPDWGVVQLVGRCTVNADGGGSNPPAPAKTFDDRQSSLFEWADQDNPTCQPRVTNRPL